MDEPTQAICPNPRGTSLVEAIEMAHCDGLIKVLQDLADIAQDRMCVTGVSHAWGPRVGTAHHAPLGFVPLEATVCDEAVTITYERRCDNCGALEHG